MTPTTEMTLSQRLTEGKIPVPQALHLAMSLADALRKLHDAGRAHGALTPSNVVLGSSGLELIPALAPPLAITSYTAPEVVQGQPADNRSDVFAFGAIVFEMLTGRRAFEGDGQAALTFSLTSSAPPASGSPAVDRLVASCVAKDPAARWQRMQKIIMELKLLTVAARRADAPANNRGQAELELRAEMQRVEARIVAGLQAHEESMAQMQQAASEAVTALRIELSAVTAEIAATQAQIAEVAAQKPAMEARIAAKMEAHEDSMAQMHQASSEAVIALRIELGAVAADIAAAQRQIAEVAAQPHAVDEGVIAQLGQTVDAVGRRVAGVEQSLDEVRRHSSTIQEAVAADVHDFEQQLRTQAEAIQSARTAMAQTDDLVERVVEALELLQSSVLDQQEDRNTILVS